MKLNAIHNNRIKVLTWHIHGSYLYYLTQAKHIDFFIPVKPGRPEGYIGTPEGSFPWGNNVHEIPAEKVHDLDLDIILFQSRKNYFEDQFKILTPRQQQLPKIYIEHDPPRETPTDTRHPVDDPHATLIHVTHFNNLMWDSNATPTVVIDHGVMVPSEVKYTGEIPKGIVVVNNIKKRGRRLGYDILEKVKQEVPLDIIGMGSEDIGGLGEMPHDQLPQFIARYRFFFNPIRYTSLGLSILEAMMIGLPVVGLATTELVTVIKNDVNGYIDTDVHSLITKMRDLIRNDSLAKQLSKNAKSTAKSRFSIDRFVKDWDILLQNTTKNHIKEDQSVLHNNSTHITL